jgi:hypothetical protein
MPPLKLGIRRKLNRQETGQPHYLGILSADAGMPGYFAYAQSKSIQLSWSPPRSFAPPPLKGACRSHANMDFLGFAPKDRRM